MRGLTFGRLRRENVARQDSYGSHGSGWSLTDWMTALAGEVGEAANIIKKVRRGDFTLEDARPALAAELADVVTYLDLLAAAAGIDLERATVEKWDEVAERIGYDGPRLADQVLAERAIEDDERVRKQWDEVS